MTVIGFSDRILPEVELIYLGALAIEDKFRMMGPYCFPKAISRIREDIGLWDNRVTIHISIKAHRKNELGNVLFSRLEHGGAEVRG